VKFARLESPASGEEGQESSPAGADVAEMKPDGADAGSSPSLGTGGGSGGGSAAVAPPIAGPAAGAQGGVAVAPPGAEVTKPSAGGDPASSAISDAEAMAVMAKTQPAAKAEPAAQTDGSGQASTPVSEVSGDPDAAATGKRKPPTLLEPGENVEKVKPPAQQQSPSK
jgi:hypothetical protein